jgi:protoporphyrinogen oxidase
MNVAIIGAGFGGLAAAWDLRRAGHEVTVFEAADYVGGLASGFKEPHWDWTVEKFYHHWFASDRHILGLIRELGWEADVLFPRPYTVLRYNGRWYPFDSILQALLFPGLGWGLDKIRFGLVGLSLRLGNNWQALEQHTAHDWMRRRAGERVYGLMWEPLLQGKFGEKYYRQVNMAWMWARLKARTTRLGTFRGGFQAFADRFAERLEAMDVRILRSTPVTHIRPLADGRLSLETAVGEARFDRVLVTVSPHALAAMTPDLPPEYLEGLLRLKHMGAVVMVFSLREQLSKEGYYWFNLPKPEGFPALALVEHTNFVSPAHFGGDHIVYVGDYLPPEHPYFSLSADELAAIYTKALAMVNPDFSPDWVKKHWMFRAQYAQPVPLVGHSAHIPTIRTPLPGLFFASMSQVYPWDRGTNYAVEIGRRAARLMMQS